MEDEREEVLSRHRHQHQHQHQQQQRRRRRGVGSSSGNGIYGNTPATVSPSSSSNASSPSSLPPYRLREVEELYFRRVVMSFSISSSSSSPPSSLPSSPLLLVHLAGGLLLCWNLNKSEKRGRFAGRRQGRYRLRAAFNEGGGEGGPQLLAGGSEDGRVLVWREGGGEEPIQALKGHGGVVSDVAWCPANTQLLASCSDDGSVRIWAAVESWEGGREGGPVVVRG